MRISDWSSDVCSSDLSDDYVTLECRGGKLVAAPPEQIAGLMEVRHVGLIRLPFITGVPVCLAIFLDRAPARLLDADVWTPAGIPVPLFALLGLETSVSLQVAHFLRVNGLEVEWGPVDGYINGTSALRTSGS